MSFRGSIVLEQTATKMADNANRNACDRCHTQKLKCKLTGEGGCERCIRLKVECKFSPSRRFKKQQLQRQQQQQQQQQQLQSQAQYSGSIRQQQLLQMHQPIQQPPPLPPQHQHQQHQPVPSAETMQIRSRSPKRQRTDSDPSLVLPEADAFAEPPMSMVLQNLEGSNAHVAVTPETVFNMDNYDFNFDQMSYFNPNPVGDTQYLSSPALPSQTGFHQHDHQSRVIGNTWNNPQLVLESLSQPYSSISQPPSLTHSVSSLTVPQYVSPLVNPTSRGDHNSKPLKDRPSRSKSRQISLREQGFSFSHQQFKTRDGVPLSRMAQLAEVNSRLMELSSVLPAHQHVETMERPLDERYKADGFPIDEMFKLTRAIADILEGVTLTGSGGDTAEAAQAKLECTDPANSMFFLSIYIRLLDMYERVFGLVRRELSQAEPQAEFRFWKLPDVTVGSFAVDSTLSLQMNLTVQLAEAFLSRLRSATAALDPSRPDNREGSQQEQQQEQQQENGGDGTSLFSGVVGSSYQAVRSKEEGLRKHLSELRAEIEALLDA